ncbi:hypothetical protein PVAND_017179 [Polypedilum vanderplanki]|uniref:Uncharacterized protein n=1 Tax=Polypedilum vanderplanki TaxID=319348 RepID=A0A9J6BHC7_POLVA|nr:hypothetical protein PVAND_017179 [Polypedilum vanderplanki]
MFLNFFALILISLIVYSNAGGPNYEESISEFYSSPNSTSTTSSPCPPIQNIETKIKTYKEDIEKSAQYLSTLLKNYAADHNKAKDPKYNQDINDIWKKNYDEIDIVKGQIISDIYFIALENYPQDCIDKYIKRINDIYNESMKEPRKRYNSLLK